MPPCAQEFWTCVCGMHNIVQAGQSGTIPANHRFTYEVDCTIHSIVAVRKTPPTAYVLAVLKGNIQNRERAESMYTTHINLNYMLDYHIQIFLGRCDKRDYMCRNKKFYK